MNGWSLFCAIKTCRLCVVLLLVLSCNTLMAQDTISVMHYNLLKYGDGNCDALENKDDYLKNIVGYAQPDILGVNEMGDNNIYAKRILAKSLNVNGVKHYQQAAYTNENGQSSLVNMLFYNDEKFVLHSQKVLNSYIRDINLYTLYLKTDKLSEGDTIFLHVLVMHLKASDSPGDAAKRNTMVTNMLEQLDKEKPGNFLLMGDLNVYRSSEAAFQSLVNPDKPDFAFQDPINQIGSWHNNSTYAQYFTQSTRQSSGAGCASTGGMDDRFDFILMSGSLMQGSANLEYINNTYEAMGQDGKRFNGSLISPSNTTLPSNVLNALYKMSDHLPVQAKLVTSSTFTQTTDIHSASISTFPNPASSTLSIKHESVPAGKIVMYDIQGNIVRQVHFQESRMTRMDVSGLPPSIYIIEMIGQNATIARQKISIQSI